MVKARTISTCPLRPLRLPAHSPSTSPALPLDGTAWKALNACSWVVLCFCHLGFLCKHPHQGERAVCIPHRGTKQKPGALSFEGQWMAQQRWLLTTNSHSCVTLGT
jgi:hypothetical protein